MFNGIRNSEIQLNDVLSFEQYNLFFAIETCRYWGNLWNIISYTKAYSFGVEIAFVLLKAFDKYQEKYSEKEKNRQLILIYTQFLKMLDKADMWEDYLINWEVIKKRSFELQLSIGKYEESSKKFHFSRGGEEFYLSDVDGGFKLCFLYGLNYRKLVIERKFEKLINNQKINNIRHEQQYDLTPSEINERYVWLSNYLTTGVYEYDSPASRQKARRKEQNRNNIIIK